MSFQKLVIEYLTIFYIGHIERGMATELINNHLLVQKLNKHYRTNILSFITTLLRIHIFHVLASRNFAELTTII